MEWTPMHTEIRASIPVLAGIAASTALLAIARRAGPMTRQQWIEQAILKHLAREEHVVAERD